MATYTLKVIRRGSVGIRRLDDPNLRAVLLCNSVVHARLLDEVHEEPSDERRLLVSIEQPERTQIVVEIVKDDPVGVAIERACKPTRLERVLAREENRRESLVCLDVVGTGILVEERGIVDECRNGLESKSGLLGGRGP